MCNRWPNEGLGLLTVICEGDVAEFLQSGSNTFVFHRNHLHDFFDDCSLQTKTASLCMKNSQKDFFLTVTVLLTAHSKIGTLRAKRRSEKTHAESTFLGIFPHKLYTICLRVSFIVIKTKKEEPIL